MTNESVNDTDPSAADTSDDDVTADDFAADADLASAAVAETPPSRLEALAAFHTALHDPGLHDEDPLVRAAALVSVADTKAAYIAAGGSSGSKYAEKFAGAYDDARALLADAAA